MFKFLLTSGFKWINPKELQLYLRLGLKLKKIISCIRIQSISMAKTIC